MELLNAIKAKAGVLQPMRITTLALILVAIVCSGVSSTTWTPAYMTAVLETRQCFDAPFVHRVLEPLFAPLNDTALADQYATSLMITLTYLIHRDSNDDSKSLCVSTIDAVGTLYREISWHKRQDTRRMAEKKVAPRRHMKQDAIINHLQKITMDGSLYAICESVVPPMSHEQMIALRECVRGARKESMRVYTRFTE